MIHKYPQASLINLPFLIKRSKKRNDYSPQIPLIHLLLLRSLVPLAHVP